jgi:hypothetical protein
VDLRIEQCLVAQRDGVGPEIVVGSAAQCAETRERGPAVDANGPARIGDDPDQAILSERARRKPDLLLVTEPVVGDLVVDVVGMKQCDEDADIEQRPTVIHHRGAR